MMKLKGIKKVCSATKSLKGFYGSTYLQLNVDTLSGDVWADEHLQGDWTLYHSKNIVICGNIYNQMTMAEIEEMVKEAIANFA